MQLKRKKYYVVITIVVLIGLLSGCNANKGFTKEYRIGVIETTGISEKSVLCLYDEEYNEVGKVDIDKGSLASVSSYVKCEGKSVYALPLGITGEYEETGILEIDMCSGERIMHNLKEQLIMDFVVDSNDIYAINADCNVSNIIKYNKNNGTISSIKMADIVLDSIFMQNNRLIVCGLGYSDDKIFSKAYFLNKSTLEVEKEIDFSNYGISVTDVLYAKGNYYFSTATTTDETKTEEKISTDIVVMDKDYNMRTIPVGETISQLILFNNDIYAVCYNKISDVGDKIIKIDNTVNAEYKLNDKARQVNLYKDKVIVLGEKTIAEYALSNNMKLIKVKTLKSNISGDEGYFSSFYINPF